MKPFKWILVGIVLVLGILLSMNCQQQQWRDIRLDAADALITLSEQGLKESKADLDRIEKNLIDVQLKIVRLEQLVTPANSWLETQKKIEHKPVAWIKKAVTPEGLSTLNNDQYQITSLEFIATQNAAGTAWDYSSSMQIKSKETGTLYDAVTIKDNLNSLKASLEQQRKSKLSAGALAISTLKSVIETVKNWNVRKVDNVFVFSGVGLGWQGKITEGEWTYQLSTKEIAPSNEAARALKDIISARK